MGTGTIRTVAALVTRQLYARISGYKPVDYPSTRGLRLFALDCVRN